MKTLLLHYSGSVWFDYVMRLALVGLVNIPFSLIDTYGYCHLL